MAVNPALDSSGLLDTAAARLRAHVDPGWVRVRSGALGRVRAAVRQAPDLPGRHDDGDYAVSGHVLRCVLRDLVGAIDRVRPMRISLTVATGGAIDVVTVQIGIAYGADGQTAASEVRSVARRGLVMALGEPGQGGRIDVAVVDVYGA